MLYTDLQYYLDDKVVMFLDACIARCTHKKVKRDSLIICEGGEGEGKTNTSIACAYYAKHKTGRPIHLFFRSQDVLDFAKNTEDQIIIFDEPALDLMSVEWFKKANKDLHKLIMTARKKRHFIICNFTKFYKFPEYFVVERALGLIHMYSRRLSEPGRFELIPKTSLENLWNDYKVKRIRSYSTLSCGHGSFPEVMSMMDKMDITIVKLPHATEKDYNDEKDKMISQIGETENDDDVSARDNLRDEIAELKGIIANIPRPIVINEIADLAKALGIPVRTLKNWKLSYEILQKRRSRGNIVPKFTNTAGEVPGALQEPLENETYDINSPIGPPQGAELEEVDVVSDMDNGIDTIKLESNHDALKKDLKARRKKTTADE